LRQNAVDAFAQHKSTIKGRYYRAYGRGHWAWDALGNLTDKLHCELHNYRRSLCSSKPAFSGFPAVVEVKIGPSGRPEQLKIVHRVEGDGRTNPFTAPRR